jgi:hypothetical protein
MAGTWARTSVLNIGYSASVTDIQTAAGPGKKVLQMLQGNWKACVSTHTQANFWEV